MVDGRYSPPAVPVNPHCFTMDIGMPVVPSNLPKEKPPINVVGDVGGRIAIIVVCLTYHVQLVFSLHAVNSSAPESYE